MHADVMMDMNAGRTENEKPLPPKHIGSPNGKPAGKIISHAHPSQGIPRIAEVDMIGGKSPVVSKTAGTVVMSSPERVHVGFNPPLESTNPADLPGSREGGGHSVITTPPHSAARTNSPGPKGGVESRPRAESIEDADKRRINYVPGLARQALDFSGRGPEMEPYCLDFTSLVRGSRSGKERSYSDSGHGDSVFNIRKLSATASDVSTISVSLIV